MRKPLTRTGRATIVSLVAAALLAIPLAGCGGGGNRAERATSPPAATAQTPAPAEASLTDLASVEDFAALFNEKEGVPRLVLLLAPT